MRKDIPINASPKDPCLIIPCIRSQSPNNAANNKTSAAHSGSLGFCVQNIPPFYFFDLLFILLTFKFEAVHVPFGEQGNDLSIIKSCRARIKRNDVLSG
jgi:hypothetical protein